MGKLDNQKLFYVSGGLAIALVLFAYLTVDKSASHFLGWGPSQAGDVSELSVPAISAQKPAKASWKRVADKSSSYRNDYTPSSSYANTYDQDINHPLVASTKFIPKGAKNKNKKAAKKAKPKTSSAARGRSVRGFDDGLSPSDSSLSGGGLTAGTQVLQAQNARKKQTDESEEQNMNSVEFWVEPIFVEEDPTAVNKLIQSYQGKKVSSNVFYEVVNDMNHDERVHIRALGIDALAATPSSKSFSQLTWVKHNDTEADLRTAAGRQIASYTDVGRLNYVVNNLKSTNEESRVTIEALRTLTDSTKKYGDLHAMQGGQPSDRQNVDYSQLETRYARALEIIDQNYANSNDANVKSEAAKTADALNKFMTI